MVPRSLQELLLHCGYSISETPQLLLRDTLAAFSRIPYENLSKILRVADSRGGILKESPEEIVSGFIKHGSGGTCFALTSTLCSFLRALGYEAHPILADRRYGQDTHCAVLCRISSESWELLDPGYRIYTPCKIPLTGSVRYELLFSSIELHATTPSTAELFTTALNPIQSLSMRYRLTYKITPVELDTFERAWERSFSWDMMHYPIVSAVRDNSILYLQKNALRIHSPTGSVRTTVTYEQIIAELADRLSMSRGLVKRALESL